MKAEVAIVGNGVAGYACAARLARHGLRPLLIGPGLPVDRPPLSKSALAKGEPTLLADAGRLAELEILDSIEWAARLLPDLAVAERVGTAVVHPTCSGAQLGVNAALVEVAGALADDVVVPESAGCCGFAGDRGLLHPELTASATAAEAAEAVAAAGDAHVCSNRTCEIGMTRASGHSYESFVFLLERLSR